VDRSSSSRPPSGAQSGLGWSYATWLSDLATWKAQGDVFLGGEPLLIPISTSVPQPSSLLLATTALAGLSTLAWSRRRRIAAERHRGFLDAA
jgi:hypothetical protein